MEGFRIDTFTTSNFDLYTSSDHLPRYLLGPKGHSYDVDETSFQEAVGTNKVRWDWLEEEVSQEELRARGIGYPGVPAADELFEGLAEGSLVRRPEHETFSLAMIGGGRVYGAAHPYGTCANKLDGHFLIRACSKLTFIRLPLGSPWRSNHR